MKFFKDIKIGTKLIAGFIALALICGIVGFVGIVKINETDKNYTDLYVNYGASNADIANVSIAYQRIKINLYKIIIEKDSNNRNEYITKIKSYSSDMEQSLEKFEKAIQTEDAKEKVSNLKKSINKYNSIQDNIINMTLSGKENESYALLIQASTQDISSEINDSIDSLFELNISKGTDKAAEYSSVVHTAITTMVIVIIFAIVVALVLGILISRSISKPISKLVGVTGEISNGNLNVDITDDSNDEIGVLSKSMKKMSYKLNEVMGNISFAAEQVTIGSKQIADSTVALSQGATEQASAVEELTASIEEISAQIKMNAENARKANDIADSTKTNAVKRNSEMKLMLNAMDEINVSSNNISKIIKVIDEIAFQTNILALNAAVEAARAGKYGKGFTVVAEEVRNLAARSAKAAKETTEIIEESIIKIEDGTNIANQTADALGKIVMDVEDVAGIINEIAIASDEQATGIAQISQGVVQISQVVQSNSATAEEGAASSEELAGQAEVLKDQVNMFYLKKDSNSNFYVESNFRENNDFSREEDLIKNKNESNPKRIILSDSEFGKY
ncbi:methyl-accepting chemotaxis protein [Clostridium cibarium]|uniref:MCP four helix bundle domain-containing protein n=1 Tax=Clostridium cibarium TaxID=2762247 RepID=A0ABR8PUA9_9CLOT|nr:MCP four helix bundle domain-containing protein [Clostridium cibarium]